MSSAYSTAAQAENLSNPQADALRAGAVYYGFETVDHGEYIIGCEKVHNVLADPSAQAVIEGQMKAAYNYLSEIPTPNYAALIKAEADYRYILFTVRHEGVLIGALQFLLSPVANLDGKLCASDNGLYLAEEHRKGFLASAMIRYAEDALRRLDVFTITLVDKEPIGGPDLSLLFRRNKYQPVSRTYVKEL